MSEAVALGQVLDDIAARAEASGEAQGPEGQGVGAGVDHEAQQQLAMVEAGARHVLMAIAKAGRKWLSKKLPELESEWSDDVLAGPIEAGIPLLKGKLSRVMELVGENPGLAAFAMSLIPLVMGYMAALNKHDAAKAQELGDKSLGGGADGVAA